MFSLVVIGLMGDFGHKLEIDDVIFFVENSNGAGEDAGERAVLDEEAIVFSKILIAHHRECFYIVHAFRPAKALLGERKVGGDDEDENARMIFGEAVQVFGHGAAYVGIEAGNGGDQFALSFEIGEGLVAEVLVYEPKVVGFLVQCGQCPLRVDNVAF